MLLKALVIFHVLSMVCLYEGTSKLAWLGVSSSWELDVVIPIRPSTRRGPLDLCGLCRAWTYSTVPYVGARYQYVRTAGLLRNVQSFLYASVVAYSILLQFLDTITEDRAA